MQGVNGKLYTDNKPTSAYRADRARADKTKETLQLLGNVRVVSEEPPGVLTCNAITYDAKRKLIRAQGNVRVVIQRAVGVGNARRVEEVGTIGTLSELWATPDLKVVSTPEMFNAR